MKQIHSSEDLQNAIRKLEIQQEIEGGLLKEEFYEVLESINPTNLILNSIQDIASSEKLKDKFLDTAIGIGTGYISKIVFEKLTDMPMKKTLGTALMFGINYLFAKNPEVVRDASRRFFNFFRSPKENTEADERPIDNFDEKSASDF
ncbi:MAG: hypothetical protein ACOYOA_02995 [Saprospiraceae bacterium]